MSDPPSPAEIEAAAKAIVWSDYQWASPDYEATRAEARIEAERILVAARAAATDSPQLAQWYLVQHFKNDDRYERKPLRSFVVQADSHGAALKRVPQHPREWGSKITPVEMLGAALSVGDTKERDA